MAHKLEAYVDTQAFYTQHDPFMPFDNDPQAPGDQRPGIIIGFKTAETDVWGHFTPDEARAMIEKIEAAIAESEKED